MPANKIADIHPTKWKCRFGNTRIDDLTKNRDTAHHWIQWFTPPIGGCLLNPERISQKASHFPIPAASTEAQPIWLRISMINPETGVGRRQNLQRLGKDKTVLKTDPVSFEEALYYDIAFQSYHKAANEGSAQAARWVSHFYSLGLPPVEKDDALRALWLAKAASLGDEISIGELRHEAER